MTITASAPSSTVTVTESALITQTIESGLTVTATTTVTQQQTSIITNVTTVTVTVTSTSTIQQVRVADLRPALAVENLTKPPTHFVCTDRHSHASTDLHGRGYRHDVHHRNSHR
jgi:hypothetical protein